MKLSEVKGLLENLEYVTFRVEHGEQVPEHFHVTEIGLLHKTYIDCGGIIRSDLKVSFQLWNANDIDHRLKPAKLLNIIRLAERKLNLPDAEIEVEYQERTIGKYGLHFDGAKFVLTCLATTCLAEDKCGISPASENLQTATSSCEPGSGCC